MEEGGVGFDVDGVGPPLGLGALIRTNPQKEKMESLRSFLVKS